MLNVGNITCTATLLPFSVTDTTTMLHISVADTATTQQVSKADAQATLQVSVAEKQAMLQVSVADTQATLIFSVAFLATNTATTPLTGNLVSVSCTLGSTTNAMLMLQFFFSKSCSVSCQKLALTVALM